MHPLRVESRRPNLSKVFDIAIGEAEAKDTVSESKRHPSKRRGGGLKGGAARAKKLSPYERRQICFFAIGQHTEQLTHSTAIFCSQVIWVQYFSWIQSDRPLDKSLSREILAN